MVSFSRHGTLLGRALALGKVSLNSEPFGVRVLLTGYNVHPADSEPVTIEFFWGGGFPVRHRAYLYRSSGSPLTPSNTSGTQSCRWSGVRRLNEHWFSLHD
jgi:hypothetical protein